LPSNIPKFTKLSSKADFPRGRFPLPQQFPNPFRNSFSVRGVLPADHPP